MKDTVSKDEVDSKGRRHPTSASGLHMHVLTPVHIYTCTPAHAHMHTHINNHLHRVTVCTKLINIYKVFRAVPGSVY